MIKSQPTPTIARSVEPLTQESFPPYASIAEKISAAVTRGKLKVLFTDIDSTFVLGAGYHQSEVEKSHADAKSLVAKLNEQGAIVIPITGSHYGEATSTTNNVHTRIARGILPQPGLSCPSESFCVDAYVTDGGAKTIRAIDSSENAWDGHYNSLIEHRDTPYAEVLQLANSTAAQVASLVSDSLDWEVIKAYDAHAQESRIFHQAGTADGRHEQAHKVAFYFYADNLDDRDMIELHFTKAFEPLGLKIVCCEEKDATSNARRTFSEEQVSGNFPLKYCLDIVPYNKATPVDYFTRLISHLTAEAAVQMSSARPSLEVWACGDAANDLPMLNSPAVTHAVIVGGASSELVRAKSVLEANGKWVYTESDPKNLGPASILKAIES